MARRNKAPTPEQMAHAKRVADLEAVNLPAGAAELPRQQSIEVTRAGEKRADADDGKRADHDIARRADAFDALRAGMAQGAYDACRRFEREVMESRREGDRGLGPLKAYEEPKKEPEFKFIVAAESVRLIELRLPPRDYWLLMDLIAPSIDRGTWRDHVAYITGERHPMAQAAAVKAASVNLRDAYVAIEGRRAA